MTELMLGVSNSGWMDYMRAEVNDISSGDDLSVRLVAPPGVGSLTALGGRNVSIPPDRIVALTADEATPLLRAGWQRVEGTK